MHRFWNITELPTFWRYLKSTSIKITVTGPQRGFFLKFLLILSLFPKMSAFSLEPEFFAADENHSSIWQTGGLLQLWK